MTNWVTHFFLCTYFPERVYGLPAQAGKVHWTFPGDARHRRLVLVIVCSVETEYQFVKRCSHLRVKNNVKSPYFTAKDFAFATA